MRSIIYFIFFFLILCSCEKEQMNDCITSTGIIQREKRSLAEFDSIRLFRRLNLVLIQDTANFIEIEAGKNLIESIKTEINNGILTIENKNTCNWMRSYSKPINIYLHHTNFKRLVLYGSNTVTTKGALKSDSITVEFRDASGDVDLTLENKYFFGIQHTGAGDLVLRGSTEGLEIYTASLGLVNTLDLNARNVLVKSLSAVDAYVNASESLYLETFAAGSIFYTGAAQNIFKESRGSGTISRIY